MNKYVNINIAKMTCYSPPLEGRVGEDLLRLDFNERTTPLSKKIIQSLRRLPLNVISKYPEYGELSLKIASYVGVSASQVIITNGSDQGMELIFRAFTNKGDQVVIPSPTFVMYRQCASLCENDVVTPQYCEDGIFPSSEVIDQICANTKLVVLCNPNNPTGTLLKLKEIEQIVKKAYLVGAIVYVDEAYYEFSGVSAVDLINKYPNLIITRTFSKAFGLAALRIGYVISNEANINELLKVRGPYDVNMMAVIAASASLEQLKDMREYVDEVMNVAKPMVERFLEDQGVNFMPSSSNFLLCRFRDFANVVEQLRANGILVRQQNAKTIENSVRITVGTEKQMKRLIKVLNSILN